MKARTVRSARLVAFFWCPDVVPRMTVGAPMMANEVSVWAQLSEVSNLRVELGRIAAGLTPARHIQPAYHGLAHTLKSPATPTSDPAMKQK